MNISTNHYKLRKVKKRSVTFVVTTMVGLTLMTAGASSASADSSTLDSQVNQTSTLVQPTSDGTSVVAPSQEKVPSNPTEVKDTDNQSENQSQPTQAASLTTQEDDKEPTSQNIKHRLTLQNRLRNQLQLPQLQMAQSSSKNLKLKNRKKKQQGVKMR